MAGIHPYILGKYESGETTPNIDMRTKLAKALKVSLGFLIGVGVTDNELDKSIINKILTTQKLTEKDKKHIMHSIDGLIQHAMCRETYNKQV